MEALRLRLKDVDFDRGEITVRDGKGGKDRHTGLPRTLVEPMRREVERARLLHEADLLAGFAEVELPFALARITRPHPASLAGSSCSRHRGAHAIRVMATTGRTTSTTRSGRAP